MSRSNSHLIAAISNYKIGSPCIITWRDAVDDSSMEFSADNIEFTEVLYETAGFFVGIKNDYILLAYNKENDGKTYKGLGYTPCPLIVDVKQFIIEEV